MAEPRAMTCIRYINSHASIFVSLIHIPRTTSLGMYYNSPILQMRKLGRWSNLSRLTKLETQSQDLNSVCCLSLNTQYEEFNLMEINKCNNGKVWRAPRVYHRGTEPNLWQGGESFSQIVLFSWQLKNALEQGRWKIRKFQIEGKA